MRKKSSKIKFLILFIVCLMMITITNISFAVTFSDDIDGIDEKKYPGIKNQIKNLQNSYNNFHFQIYYTGIDWTEAVTMEYQGHKSSPKNLVSEKNTGSASTSRCGKWFCPICGENHYDSGYYCASKEAIEYMMDPRNSLENVSDIFQFKNLEYSDVSNENIQRIITSNYSTYSYLNNPVTINAITTASNNLNLNGYSIIAKIINEQGSGTSSLIKGVGYNGNYVGYYNFFNIGAYGNGSSTIINNGLKYAQNAGWNSVESSILGGAQIYKNSYIGKGQNTLYFQRFNVINNESLFSHQYQQDVMGAETSSILMKGYYDTTGTLTTTDHYFIIPVYENMPSTKCKRPSTTENNNLIYEETTIKKNGVAVCAAPNSSRIIGYLNSGETVKVLKKATKVSSDGNYWDEIVTDTDGTYGYINRNGIKEVIPKYIFDPQFYYEKYGDLRNAFPTYDENILWFHFQMYGIKEGRAGSSTLDIKYYLKNNSDLVRAFGENNYEMAYMHFVNCGCNEFRKTSPEYDGKFYGKIYPNLNSVQLMIHYIESGKPNGELASGFGNIEYSENLVKIYNSDVPKYIFDAEYYLERNKDVAKAFGDKNYDMAYVHFVNCGIKEGRNCSKTLDIKYYLNNNNDLKRAFGENNYEVAYNHFVSCGCNEFRNSSSNYSGKSYHNDHPETKMLNSKQLMMYYILTEEKIKQEEPKQEEPKQEEPKQEEPKQEEPKQEEPKQEIVFTNVNFPLPTYIFDVNYYYYYNRDLRNAFGKNADMLYAHFITYGIKEGRAGSAAFDVKYYLDNNTDLVRAFGKGNYVDAYNHFINYGVREGRTCSRYFNAKYYLQSNEDLIKAYGATNYEAAINHFMTYGINEGRKGIQ